MEVVINTCFGGFGLSEEAERKLKQLLSEQLLHDFIGTGSVTNPIRIHYPDDEENLLDGILYTSTIEYRSNRFLVRIVKEMEEKANSKCSNLKVISIPDDAIEPYITDYDGMEHVAEGRIWR